MGEVAADAVLNLEREVLLNIVVGRLHNFEVVKHRVPNGFKLLSKHGESALKLIRVKFAPLELINLSVVLGQLHK